MLGYFMCLDHFLHVFLVFVSHLSYLLFILGKVLILIECRF